MPELLSRRNFLKSALCAAILPGLAYASSNLKTPFSDIALSEVPLIISDLPKEFIDYRIAFLSDLHLGVWASKDYVAQAFDAVQALNADTVFLGGDYVGIVESLERAMYSWSIDRSLDAATQDQQVDKSFAALSQLMKGLTAKDGTFGVVGNHDQWWGPKQCKQAFIDARCTLLINQVAKIQRGSSTLEIIGLDDLWTGLPQYPDNLSAQATRIVLSHNPDYITQLWQRNLRFDLALSGHTHGGQVVLPGIGALSYNIENTQFASGLFSSDNKKDGQVYTSRGIGFVKVPYRYKCSPEVTLFTLKAG